MPTGLPVVRLLSSSVMPAIANTLAVPSDCASLASPQGGGLPRRQFVK